MKASKGLRIASRITTGIGAYNALSSLIAGLILGLMSVVYFAVALIWGGSVIATYMGDGLEFMVAVEKAFSNADWVGPFVFLCVSIEFVIISTSLTFLNLLAVIFGILGAATKKNSKFIYIVNIILGYMASITVMLVGGILGVIAVHLALKEGPDDDKNYIEAEVK